MKTWSAGLRARAIELLGAGTWQDLVLLSVCEQSIIEQNCLIISNKQEQASCCWTKPLKYIYPEHPLNRVS